MEMKSKNGPDGAALVCRLLFALLIDEVDC
jgi:hypothetical protein